MASLALLVGCSAPRPEHIVLVVIDTLRRDHLPAFGGDAHTPHLSALAARGKAVAAHASFHQTTMSMGALFTGRTPSIETGEPSRPLEWGPVSACGMARFAREPREGVCLPPEVPVLGEAMKRRGYLTVGVVASVFLFDPAGFSRGFDRWEEVGITRPVRARRAARGRDWPKVNAAVRRVLADLPEAPTFLYVHYLDVHDWPHLERSYRASLEEMDRGIGDLLAILDEHGLRETAAIVLTSDHGEMLEAEHLVASLPLHGGNPSYSDVLDIPLLLVGAEGMPLPAFPRSEDLFHSLLALAGEPTTNPRDLEDGEVLVTELAYQTYRRGRFKSLRRRDGAHYLLDLESDPGETRDVAADHPEVVEAHRRRMEALGNDLAAEPEVAGASQVSEEWFDRLRALGYIE